MKRKRTRHCCRIEAVEPRRLLSTVYVDANATGPVHDGLSWETAFVDLVPVAQNATAGTEILVADGSYMTPWAGSPGLYLHSGVKIYGGYAGASDPLAARNISEYVTTLTGPVSASNTDNTALLDGVTSDGAYIGVYMVSGSATISNCIFTDLGSDSSGGAMRFENSTPTIINCVFSGNVIMDTTGGGAIASYNSTLTIIGCTFADGDGCNYGGAIYNYNSTSLISDCTFIDNYAWRGGAIANRSGSTAIVTNCTFSGSYLYDMNGGGGIYNESSTASLVGCTFIEQEFGGILNVNSALTATDCLFTGGSGSGINTQGTSTLNLLNCTFSSLNGRGIFNNGSSATLNDCTFTSNTSTLGAGMHNLSAASVVLNNCVFDGNSAITVPNGGDSLNGLGGGMCNLSSTVTLTNCAFRNNSATATNGNSSNFQGLGGGIYNDSSTITVSDCEFANNVANASSTDYEQGFGGGMYNSNSSVTIGDSAFIANSAFGNPSLASGHGGGMYNSNSSISATNCKFIANSTQNRGGAVDHTGSSLALANCYFDANSAWSTAAGIRASSSQVTITDCIFTAHNQASINVSSSSGLIARCTFVRNVRTAIVTDSSTLTVMSCSFLGNTADRGAAIIIARSSPLIVNCIFVGNTALSSSSGRGGAISTSGTGGSHTPKIRNCTFIANSATVAGGAIASLNASLLPELFNCILWNNTAPAADQIELFNGASVSVKNSDIQGGWAGAGNIDADPQFVRNPDPGLDGVWGTTDDDYGDLRLRATSPSIDAGDNTAVPGTVTTDLAGNPRIVDTPTVHDPGSIVDMGAYEYQSPLEASGGVYQHAAARPTVRVYFNGDLNPSTIEPADLVLLNQTTGQTIDTANLATVSYDPATRSATWSFNTSLLPDGNYLGTLASGSVNDVLGNPLATTYQFGCFVLAGDANHDGIVNVVDLQTVAMNWQGNGKVFSQGDFNYDTKVDEQDLAILCGNWQKTPNGALSGPLIPIPSIIPVTPPPMQVKVATLAASPIKRTPLRVVSLIA